MSTFYCPTKFQFILIEMETSFLNAFHVDPFLWVWGCQWALLWAQHNYCFYFILCAFRFQLYLHLFCSPIKTRKEWLIASFIAHISSLKILWTKVLEYEPADRDPTRHLREEKWPRFYIDANTICPWIPRIHIPWDISNLI